MILAKGPGASLSKIDIKSAYRIIPIHPDDRHLLGIKWEGSLYVDTCLPFGLQSAPKIFTAVADAVQWILEQGGVLNAIHYLDDFLLVGDQSKEEGRTLLDKALVTFDSLRLPVAPEKLEVPQLLSI